MPPVTRTICLPGIRKTCVPAEVKSLTVQAIAPKVVTLPPKTEFVLLSANAVNWSHDPLASAQNHLMLPGVSTSIPVDAKTLPEILSLINDPRVIRIRADMLQRAKAEITAAVEAALKAGKKVEVKAQDGDYGWVVSEVWKKYLQKRFPTAGLDKSFLGACGEPENYVTPQAPQAPEPVFWGDTPYLTGDRLTIGALIAITPQKHAVRFCQFGDSVANKDAKPIEITLQICDGHLGDNSGHVELQYYFAKLK